MLTIKRRHSTIKAITAGSVAFAIGLTGATAFIGDNFQSDPSVYNKEQNASINKQDPVPIADTADQSTASESSESQNETAATTTQPASSDWAFAPATTSPSATPAPTTVAPAPAPAPAAPAPAAPSPQQPAPAAPSPTGGSGGGSGSSLPVIGPVVDTVLQPVEGTTCTLQLTC